MKNFLIFLSVVFLGVMAFVDTKSVLEEIAAITPAQTEMKQDLQNSKCVGIEKRFDSNNINKNEIKNSPLKMPQQNFATPQNTTKEISPRLNPIEKRN